MDTFAVGTALAAGLARQFGAEVGEEFGETGVGTSDAAAGRLCRRLLPSLSSSPDAAGALGELRRNPRNRAAGLVLGDEISHVLDADPELLRLAIAAVGGTTGSTAAAA